MTQRNGAVRTSPGISGNRAFTLIELMIVIALIAVVSALAIPNLIEARKSSNEAAAIASIKSIGSAQAIFRERDKDGDGELAFTSLATLASFGLVDPVLGSGEKQGYKASSEASSSHPEALWWAVCTPAVPGTTGDRAFATNNTGLIYFTTAATLTPDPATCLVTGAPVLGN